VRVLLQSILTMNRQRTALRLAATVAIGLCTLGLDAVWSQGPRNDRRPSTTWLDGHEVVDGEVLVRYRAEASGVIQRQRAEFQAEADEVEVIGRRGMRRMRSRRLGTRAMIQTLRDNPDVEFAEPNYVIRVDATPNDPSFGALWGLRNIGQTVNGSIGTAGADISAPQAWDITTGSPANVVGVIDTGVDYRHPDLAANMWSAPRAFSVVVGGVVINCAAGSHGFNAINNTCDPMDDHYHGTHVAGTIGAVGHNGVGITGVSWVTSMMGLKFLGSSGSGSTADAIKAIEFAIQAKAALGTAANVRILSNSWGGGGYSQALKTQIDAAAAAEMLFVAAAGNSGLNTDINPHYPSSYTSTNVISIAATTNRDQRASFSNYGYNSVDLGAPGQTIVSTMPNSTYASLSGTSMAAPHVSGAAALMLAACPMTTVALKAALLGSVAPVASLNGITSTGGRLDVNAAVRTCTPPSLLVGGQSGAIIVQGGSTITVDVRNGPGFVSDFLMMVPAGAAPQTWGPYFYLSGTKTRPTYGMTNATVQFTAPSTGGSYEFRLYENDTFTLRATSAVVTATTANPIPVISSLSPASVASGSSAFTLTVNGAGFTAGSQVRVNGTARATSVVSAATLTTAIQASEIASGGALAISVITPLPGGGTSGNATLSVKAPPLLTVNNATGPVTVTSGSTITVGVTNGPGFVSDWVMMVPAGAPAQSWGAYQYLSGSKTRPATGLTTANLQFVAPSSGSGVEFRFYKNDTFELLATSSVITVSGSNPSPAPPATPAITINGSSSAVSVTRGTAFSVGISNGPANISDWVMMVPVGSPPQTWGPYMYLSGSKTRPASGLASASFDFTAPSAGGDYELRFYANDGWTLLATSAVVTVSSAQPALRINGVSGPVTVRVGSTINVNVSNGPGHISDWVMMVPAGAAPQTWGTYMYLSGTKTRPAAGMTSATIAFTAPASAGNYEFRFYQNDGWTLLATSATVTVTP
jgi:subtilisin family serine protease